jgi:hypothetical protein
MVWRVDHLDRGFGKPVMAFHVDDQMPVTIFRNGEPDRRFLRDAADIFEIEGFRKTLKIGSRHQADVVHRVQRDFDHRACTLRLKVVMLVAEIGPRHICLIGASILVDQT